MRPTLSILLILSIFKCTDTNWNKEKQIVTYSTKDTTIYNIDLVQVMKGPYLRGLHFATDTLNYDYWIGKYEVSNAQYYSFVKHALADSFIYLKEKVLYYKYKGNNLLSSAAYKIKHFNQAIYLRNDSIILTDSLANHPAVGVTWFGAKAFCLYYGFDLPSEGEWEKAARGSKHYWFPWGNYIDSSYANYYNSNDPFEPGTTPVGYFNGKNQNGFQTSNAISVYGCYDMAGNAWEWTNDLWTSKTPYNKGKGGGFMYHTPAFLQIYYTSTFGPETPPPLDMCHLSDGFRVVKH